MKVIQGAAALALLAMLAASPVAAQTGVAPAAAQSAVGRWLYGPDGEIVGSVYALTDGGRTAVVQYGTILTPGNKRVAIPAGDVALVDGRATLRSMTAGAVRSLAAVN